MCNLKFELLEQIYSNFNQYFLQLNFLKVLEIFEVFLQDKISVLLLSKCRDFQMIIYVFDKVLNIDHLTLSEVLKKVSKYDPKVILYNLDPSLKLTNFS